MDSFSLRARSGRSLLAIPLTPSSRPIGLLAPLPDSNLLTSFFNLTPEVRDTPH